MHGEGAEIEGTIIMSNEIEFEKSKMQLKFRVVAYLRDGKKKMLSSWSDYASAEKACWAYDGDAQEVFIRKVWVKQ